METGQQEPARSHKMVIADDDPAILRLLADRCARLGFQIETATNGVQLLLKVRHNHPDVVIADVNMPALDGLSVCARLLDPGHKPLEVVVITGGANPETAERCASLGTYFGRKGPNFWNEVMAALTAIYPDLADKATALPARPPLATTPERPRVLVVDHDADYGKFLASRLAKSGVDMLYAPDALEACRLAAKEKPGVIVCDYFMPDGDAQFLLHRLRARRETATVPVVVVSARRLAEVDELNLKREILGWPGACTVLPKTFDTVELFDTLRKYCAFKRQGPPTGSEVEEVGW